MMPVPFHSCMRKLLRDEEEKAQAIIATMGGTTVMASAHPWAKSTASLALSEISGRFFTLCLKREVEVLSSKGLIVDFYLFICLFVFAFWYFSNVSLKRLISFTM